MKEYMPGRTNKDKEPDPLIEEVLAETDTPDITEPLEEEISPEIKEDLLPDPDNQDDEPEAVVEPPPTVPTESDQDKEKRYKSQQAEAQIQAERNKAIIEKVAEASGVIIPTEQELRAFVAQDNIEWDEMTSSEQILAKRAYINDKKFSIVQEAITKTQAVDQWAKSVDDFIDSTDGQPEYLRLSGNEFEFRRFAMKESHRGTPMEVLLGAFLHSLPPIPPKRGSLFETGGGGEKDVRKDGITDAETSANLRRTNPKEWRRQVKAGKIKLEV